MVFHPDIHNRRSVRLQGYNYSCAGSYFVTICVHDRECLFGEVVGDDVVMNEAGKTVSDIWGEMESRFPAVSLDYFIVMPNHFHGILVLSDDAGATHEAPGSPKLGDIVRAFKSITAVTVNRMLDRHGVSLWQRNYFERVIRSDGELDALRQYVVNNPANWAEDKNNPSRREINM